MRSIALQWLQRGWLSSYRRCRIYLQCIHSSYRVVAAGSVAAVVMLVGIVMLGGDESLGQGQSNPKTAPSRSPPEQVFPLAAVVQALDPTVAAVAMQVPRTLQTAAEDVPLTPLPSLDVAAEDQDLDPTVAMQVPRILQTAAVDVPLTPLPSLDVAAEDQALDPTVAAVAVQVPHSLLTAAVDVPLNSLPSLDVAAEDQASDPTVAAVAVQVPRILQTTAVDVPLNPLPSLDVAAEDQALDPTVAAVAIPELYSLQAAAVDVSLNSLPSLDVAAEDQASDPIVAVAAVQVPRTLQTAAVDVSLNSLPSLDAAAEDQASDPIVAVAAVQVPRILQTAAVDVSLNSLPSLDVAAEDQASDPTVAVAAIEPDRVEGSATQPKSRSLTAVIASGDSLSSLFSKLKIAQSELALMVNTSTDNKQMLSNLSPGQQVQMEISTDTRVQKFVLHLGPIRELHLTRAGDSFDTEIVELSIEWRSTTAYGIINDSLYAAAQRAGLSRQMITKLIDILGWDIDFALDIRRGDQFKMVYDEAYVRDKKINNDRIIAVEFINQSKIIQAVRYSDPNGYVAYYTPEGLSMRKEFLRSPVEFSRISSRFNLKRLHPVMHQVRAHRGVDYVAARGTPVKSTADGRIASIGRNGGYGRAITVQHGSNYSTLYAHLLRYKKGLGRGQQIRQGDIIGYVGKTGLATGYHLHYEFRVNGVHKDPLRFKFPQGASIEKEFELGFLAQTADLLKQLNNIPDTRFASLN